jgi:hypothetical protein
MERQGKYIQWNRFPIVRVNYEKLKDPKYMPNAFNYFFTTVTEKLNIQQIKKEMLSQF